MQHHIIKEEVNELLNLLIEEESIYIMFQPLKRLSWMLILMLDTKQLW